jgi:hypothetical protein
MTKVRGGWAVVWDSAAEPPQHRVVERGEVVILGDRILYAGPCYEGPLSLILVPLSPILCAYSSPAAGPSIAYTAIWTGA